LAPEQISCQGLDQATSAQVQEALAVGGQLKLVATARLVRGKVQGAVGLEVLPDNHPLAACTRERNGLVVETSQGQETLVTGKGAGRWPTTVSVLADTLDLHRIRQEGLCATQPIARRKSA